MGPLMCVPERRRDSLDGVPCVLLLQEQELVRLLEEACTREKDLEVQDEQCLGTGWMAL